MSEEAKRSGTVLTLTRRQIPRNVGVTGAHNHARTADRVTLARWCVCHTIVVGLGSILSAALVPLITVMLGLELRARLEALELRVHLVAVPGHVAGRVNNWPAV